MGSGHFVGDPTTRWIEGQGITNFIRDDRLPLVTAPDVPVGGRQ